MLEDPYEYEPESKPRLIIPALIWLGVIISSIVIALMLTGCATESFQGLCAIQQTGQTDSGVPVIRVYCEAQS
jgi:hypothetical protein